MSSSVLRSFRIVAEPHLAPLVEELLTAQGYAFEPEPFSPLCRRLLREPRPLGDSLAATFGLIYIQDRSSMLPPLALNPSSGASVLDICASPGSKTSLLAQMVGKTGFVLGNEPSRDRLATLRQNLARMNLAQVATCSLPGQELPLAAASLKRILLDPPCSGWGTAAKNPRVLDLWQEDNVAPLVALQRTLLVHAARLLAPGGRLVYSTCTTNRAENEDQVRFALDELGLELHPLAPQPGFAFETPHGGLSGVLRVDGAGSAAQGFFIAALQKPGSPDDVSGKGEAAPLPGTRLDPEELEIADGLEPDWARLPQGEIYAFGQRAFFLPRAALSLPRGLSWQGFVLGKLNRPRGKERLILRPGPRVRLLLPDAARCPEQRRLQLETPQDILALLSGRSLNLPGKGAGVALYFRGLPLARLSRKGDRVVLAA